MCAAPFRENTSVNVLEDANSCIICGKNSTAGDLHSPKDKQSWIVLYNAALRRNFKPITQLGHIPDHLISSVKLHRKCRCNFTHVKALKRLEENAPQKSSDSDCEGSSSVEKQSKRIKANPSITEPTKVCIFCDKDRKYPKRSKSAEPLLQGGNLSIDRKLSDIAITRGDSKIKALTTKDSIDANKCYHRSCYHAYTRARPEKSKQENQYVNEEKRSMDKLYSYIREDLFKNPRVEAQSDLLEKLVADLSVKVEKVLESTKKNFQHKLNKEFGASLKFYNIEGKVYVVPESFDFDLLLTTYVKTKNALEDHLRTRQQKNCIPEMAKQIKEDLRKLKPPQVWPPSPQEFHSNQIDLPSSLLELLNSVIASDSPRSSTAVWSIAQDIVYAASKGTVLTPKHFLLSMTCKTLTGNVQLLSILNKLGHGCSYSKLLEIDTALCMNKLSTIHEGEIPLPSSIHANIPTVLAYDNIDRTEETLSGAGTSHRVNGIIVQPTSSTCLPAKPATTIKHRKQRSISMSTPCIPDYVSSQRKNPPAITTLELPQKCIETLEEAQRKNLLWVISRLYNEEGQSVPSWTGFNILTRDDVDIEADTIAYLPCINKPATEMSTVNEILSQSIKIKSQLQINEITLVLDQAIFAKAMEVVWCHQDTFKDVFIMMGGFHTICNLLSIIGKLFGDAGLGDLAVEMGAIAQGSLKNVLQGKQYNRGVRLHKYIYEALMRIIYKQFLNDLKLKYPELIVEVQKVEALQQNLSEKLCNDAFKTAIEDPATMKLLGLLTNYLNHLKNDNGPLLKFWMTYIEMVELLLGLIRSTREGNWFLFMICIEQMIPWCFALDKINYARYLSINFAEMTNLSQTHPEINEYFEEGGFSVQLGEKNPFSRIPVDQTLEETVNKDTQTSGGTRGFSLNEGAVDKYYITAEYRASALSKLREMLNVTSSLSHSDLHKPRIKIDEVCVSTAVQLLENEWTNPFDPNGSDIVSLSTGRGVSQNVQTSLLNVRKMGEDAYENFKKDRLEKGIGFFEPIKKNKLKTFTTTTVSKLPGQNKYVITSSDRNIFSSMILLAENSHLNMLEVFSHTLGPLPWSLANPDGSMKKNAKAVLGQHLESLVTLENIIISSQSATIIDGMAIIQKLHGENKTFDQLSDSILNAVLNTAQKSTRIDVVFDSYAKKSIKSAERLKRGSEGGIIFKNIKGGHKVIKWRSLLQSGESKTKLIEFISKSWQSEKKRLKIGTKELYLTTGNKCIKITGNGFKEVEHLASSHEEADTRMMLHIRDAALEYSQVVCVSDDTDVLVIGLSIALLINQESKLYIKRCTRGRIRLIDMTKLALTVGPEMTAALPALHAWTGCDTVSAFSGQGKLKALKLLNRNPDFQILFSRIGNNFTLTKNDLDLIQQFTCQLYLKATTLDRVNPFRYSMFRSRKGRIESSQLPPCEDCLIQHTRRANYQAAIWRRCLDNFPELPKPEHHGWVVNEEGMLSIQWMTRSPAPDAVLALMSCSCARSCKPETCTCIAKRMKCTSLCKLAKCTNRGSEENTQEEECPELHDSEWPDLDESGGEDDF